MKKKKIIKKSDLLEVRLTASGGCVLDLCEDSVQAVAKTNL